MKQYNKIFVRHDPEVDGVFMDDNYYVYHETFMGSSSGLKVVPKENVIILTPDELLDLMQEAIEHSHPVLSRDEADKFLASKFK